MGQQSCCRERVKLPDLDEDLHISNNPLIEEIQELREQHEEEIKESKVTVSGETIFRGKIDKNSHKYGYGEHYFRNYVYFGMFEANEPNGHGLAIKDDYSYYKGDFKNKLFHGFGKEYGKDYFYEGQFENGSRKNGIFRNDLFQYHGPFKDNLFEGQGTIVFSEGTKYEGSFKKGKPSGKGIVVFLNGKIFKGELQNGKCKKGKFFWGAKLQTLDQQEDCKVTEEKEEQEDQLMSDNLTDYLLFLFRNAKKNKQLANAANPQKSGLDFSPSAV